MKTLKNFKIEGTRVGDYIVHSGNNFIYIVSTKTNDLLNLNIQEPDTWKTVFSILLKDILFCPVEDLALYLNHRYNELAYWRYNN